MLSSLYYMHTRNLTYMKPTDKQQVVVGGDGGICDLEPTFALRLMVRLPMPRAHERRAE